MEADYWYLLTSILNMSRSEMLLKSEADVGSTLTALVKEALVRLEKGEVPQYIVGKTWFRGLELRVNSAVLIPRPETEGLIDLLLPRLEKNAHVLDIGTGSGAIAISLKKERPDLTVDATDISLKALQIAQSNAEMHDAVIRFYEADLFPPIDIRYDCLVSNPPYISSLEMNDLDPRVRDYEPRLALWGGDDGLDVYRTILAKASDFLRNGGIVAIEHGYQQKDALVELALENYWSKAETFKDMSGRDRFLVFQR